MLNKNIKIDLHIHSIASDYKESKKEDGTSIVSKSTKENLDILLNKLLENDVSLFSITDHNRFDSSLYAELEKRIVEEKYKEKLNFLCGVEFDVVLERDKKPAHIITIFDAKTSNDRKNIEDKININLRSNSTDSYTKDEYETLLKSIGLSTILIIRQKCSLNAEKGNHKSLSEACNDPYAMIKIGYFDALEFQKPNVEGILLDNLSNVDTEISLITGSDCHDWSVYPRHDSLATETEHYFSKIKSLPTFKGLLMALTSIKTRFNRVKKTAPTYLTHFTIDGKVIPLDPGINVIIGENGSGKSSLLNIFADELKENHVKKIKDNNNINVSYSKEKIKYISQAQIVNYFHEGQLFPEDNYFDSINHTSFENEYREFSENLKSRLKLNIDKNSRIEKLNNLNFEVNYEKEGKSTYYVTINEEDLCTEENIHKDRITTLKTIHQSLANEYKNSYYSSTEKDVLNKAMSQIAELIKEIKVRYVRVENENKIKNIIVNKSKDYNISINNISTCADKEIREYNKEKNSFINHVVFCIKDICTEFPKIELPKVVSGITIKRINGFLFTKTSAYHNTNVLDRFLKIMFVKEYRELQKLDQIKTNENFKTALFGCTDIDDIETTWNSNIDKFFNEAKKSKSFIQEERSNNEIGNTLGEISLAYYKFQTGIEMNKDILMIDQPEDNISNIKIANKLINYLDSLRDKKQLIIVTHNPLIVVNLDADNVIHLHNINGKIQISSGCLEYVDNSTSIIDLVADTLDGGKEMIQKRLKIYG